MRNDRFLSLFNKYNAIIRFGEQLEDFKFIMSANKICLSDSNFSWWAAFLSNAEEIYFPMSIKSHWMGTVWQDINLRVDDENRYIYVKYKEISEKIFNWHETLM